MSKDAFKLQKLAFIFSGLFSLSAFCLILILRTPANNQNQYLKSNVLIKPSPYKQGNSYKNLSSDLTKVPFTSLLGLSSSDIELGINVSNGQSRLVFDDGTIIDFRDKPGVPLKVIDLGANKIVVFREMYSNSIYVFVYDYQSKLTDSKELALPGAIKPIFRQAFSHNGDLMLVLYDNSKRVNYVERHELDGGIFRNQSLKLAIPSFEDPAGSNYEMMANIFVHPVDSKSYWLAAGSFLGLVKSDEIFVEHRIPNCLRVQEFVALNEFASVLCVNRFGYQHAFSLSSWNASGSLGAYKHFDGKAVPFNLRFSNGRLLFDLADTSGKFANLLRFDLERNHSSGIMEMASSNVEGRVAWSQIYYLNGYLDFLELASKNSLVRSKFESILPDLKKRLDIEISLLLLILKSDERFLTKAFTVDRSPTLFAVQTSRLLLLLNRYHRLSNVDNIDPFHLELFKSVATLSGHIDVLAVSDGNEHGLANDAYYLKWPKGSSFPFDGLNVPYNHQNEWAYSILDSLSIGQLAQELDDVEPVEASFSIIDKFVKDNISTGIFPSSGEWPYWWGRAYEGWTDQDGISANIPSYNGDRSMAFISFKSIDVLSLMSALYFASEFSFTECSTAHGLEASNICSKIKDLLELQRYKYFVDNDFVVNVRASIAKLIGSGKLYPYAAYSLYKVYPSAMLGSYVSAHYSRLNAPWELRNAVWALHSRLLE